MTCRTRRTWRVDGGSSGARTTTDAPAAARDQRPGGAHAEVVVAIIRRVRVATGRPRVCGDVAEAAAAVAPTAGAVPGALAVPGARAVLAVPAPLVLAPLPYVAVHVAQSPAVGREAADWRVSR